MKLLLLLLSLTSFFALLGESAYGHDCQVIEGMAHDNGSGGGTDEVEMFHHAAQGKTFMAGSGLNAWEQTAQVTVEGSDITYRGPAHKDHWISWGPYASFGTNKVLAMPSLVFSSNWAAEHWDRCVKRHHITKECLERVQGDHKISVWIDYAFRNPDSGGQEQLWTREFSNDEVRNKERVRLNLPPIFCRSGGLRNLEVRVTNPEGGHINHFTVHSLNVKFFASE